MVASRGMKSSSSSPRRSPKTVSINLPTDSIVRKCLTVAYRAVSTPFSIVACNKKVSSLATMRSRNLSPSLEKHCKCRSDFIILAVLFWLKHPPTSRYNPRKRERYRKHRHTKCEAPWKWDSGVHADQLVPLHAQEQWFPGWTSCEYDPNSHYH
jgi:hypothetical protein